MFQPGPAVASLDDRSATMRRWRTILRWTPKIRRRRAIEAARAWQEQERAAARELIIGVAAVLDRPLRAQPPPPEQRPLLTRGQEARTRLPKHSRGPRNSVEAPIHYLKETL